MALCISVIHVKSCAVEGWLDAMYSWDVASEQLKMAKESVGRMCCKCLVLQQVQECPARKESSLRITV